MMKMKNLFLFAAIAMAATGCKVYTLVDKGQKVTVDEAYSVQPSQQWSFMTSGNIDLWTRDGHSLQGIYFPKEVTDGTTLFRIPVLDSSSMQKFRKDMTLPEIQDLFVSTFSQMQRKNLKVQKMSPAEFGGEDGFRIDFSYSNLDGVKYRGFMLGTIKNDELHSAIYYGADIHYFDLNSQDAEELIRSAIFVG